ncbi:MAG: CDP-glucose 4,6-dehydratase [Rhodospirillaceae bacterium]
MAKRPGPVESMVISSRFWSGRRVFVTGHTGFKGAWLCLWLQRLGAQVAGYALEPPTDPNLFTLAGVAGGMGDERGDVRDFARLTAAVTKHRPEIVIHLAAQSLVRLSYCDPITTFTTNVMGTVNLLEALRRVDTVRAAIIVTTDKCYSNQEWVWGYREIDALGGHDPYSSSKACAELATVAYRDSFFPLATYANHGVAVASARAGNVVGGGDWALDRLVPDAMRAFITGQCLEVRNPDSIRPWQHVLDPLAGYLQLAQRLVERGPEFACAWNFGPSSDGEQPVRALIERLIGLWGPGAAWRVDEREKPHEANYLKLDCSQARSRLNWCPSITFDQMLRLTVDWYRAQADGGDLRAMTLHQINTEFPDAA